MTRICSSTFATAGSNRSRRGESSMPALFRTLVFRRLRRQPLRALLVIAGVGVGVASWIATDAFQQSFTRSVRQAAAPLSGEAHLTISNGEAGVPLELVDK